MSPAQLFARFRNFSKVSQISEEMDCPQFFTFMLNNNNKISDPRVCVFCAVSEREISPLNHVLPPSTTRK